METSDISDMSRYWADKDAPFVMLSSKGYFDQFTSKEKLYAHYMSKACHSGIRIVLRQVSHESESIFDLILTVHKSLNGKYPVKSETEQYLEYVSQFLSNLGNYTSFGDTKFIPSCSKEFFYRILTDVGIEICSKPATMSCPYNSYKELIESGIYYVDSKSSLLGFQGEGHTSGYYFGDVNEKDMKMLQDKVFTAYDLMPENVRIKKHKKTFTILVSAAKNSVAVNYPVSPIILPDGSTVSFVFGDHSREMEMIVGYLEKATKYCANSIQYQMLCEYIKFFDTGDMKAHKRSQEFWVKDFGPLVETNIGFIETYREPSGVIAEYEGFVAMKNKEKTKKLTALVQNAKKFIEMLPWGPEFEKSEFQPPDFTSLEVLTFTTSGIPSGINIPNYNDVRERVGFKNVSLGNIVTASLAARKNNPSFIDHKDVMLYQKYLGDSFEVQVAIHELLGHGSGKLFTELEDGTFNFDKKNPPLGVDGKPIKHNYSKNETWSSKFGHLSGSYEECRAELTAMYLIINRDLLSIFGFKDNQEQDDVIYIAYLQMARMGLLALEYWSPSSNKWLQPHMRARFSIFKTFLQYSSNSGFLKLTHKNTDFSDLKIHLNRDMIISVGHEATKDFLRHLHIYKASGDVENGSKYFIDKSTVTPELAKFKDIVSKMKQPRIKIIQPNTVIDAYGNINIHEYPENALGMLDSFLEREF